MSSVRLGYVRHADDLDFSYAAGTTRTTNLTGAECQLLYTRTTRPDHASSGSVNTPCHDPEDSYQGTLTPFDATAFDPSVMVQLLDREIGERTDKEEIPSVTLMRESGGELVYVVNPGEEPYELFDLEGYPVE